MRVLSLLALLCTVAVSARKAKEAKAKAEPKVSKLARAFKEDPLYALTDATFGKYISDRPREYHAVVMFTATAPQYQCGVCVKTLETFEAGAELYHQQYDFNSSKEEQRLAFFVVEVDGARKIFGDMGLETVPKVYVLPPQDSASPKMKISNFEMQNRALLEGPSAFLAELEGQSGVKVEMTLPPLLLLTGLCILAALTALFIAHAKQDFYSALLCYQSPYLWVGVSMVCFSVGVSGSISCIIRSSPVYGLGRSGEVQIFSSGGRDQFVLEGVVVVLMTLGAALSAHLTSRATYIKFPLVRHLLVLLSMAVCATLFTHIFQVYVIKTPWYTLKDTMPPELHAWMAANVKKSSSLFKRLFRVSQIWLESKDLSGFYRKFKLLVVDYIMRSDLKK